MKLVTHYLLRALLLSMVFVTLAVTAAVWLTQSLRYVDVVVENGAPLHMFVWLALLTLPVFLSLAIPVALFVAVLFTYNRLTQDAELVAMRACGISPRRLAWPAILLALVTVVIGYILTLYIQPAASRELSQMQYFVQSQFSAALLKEGTFNDLGNKMTVYVAKRSGGAELSGLLIYDGRNPDKPLTIRADRGQLVQNAKGPQVVVYDGVQQEYNRTTHQLSELTFESYTVSLDSIVSQKNIRPPAPREYTTAALFYALVHPTSDPENTRKRELQRLATELHQRILTPLLSLGFTLIACLCLLTGEYNRRGQTKRVALAIFLAALLQATAMGLSGIAGESPLLAVPFYLGVILPILIGGGMLLHADRLTREEEEIIDALHSREPNFPSPDNQPSKGEAR